jgi:hypothetical protein
MDGGVKLWFIDKSKRNLNKDITSFLKAAQGIAVHPNLEYVIAVGNDPCVRMCSPVSGNRNRNRPYDNWYTKRTFERYHFKKGVVDKD